MIAAKILTHGEASFSIAELGTGPALIFLHAGVADKRMFENAHEAFSGQWRTISYDRRGFGRTISPDESFSHIEDLRAILDYLDLEKAHLVGCSQGGRVAVSFALTYPERVVSLTLVGTAVSGAPQPNGYPQEVAKLIARIDAAQDAGELDLVNELECQLWFDGSTSRTNRVDPTKRDLFLDMNMIALSHSEFSLSNEPPSAWERLSEIHIPTLCLCGDLDLPHLKDRTRDVAVAIPNALAKFITSTAHLPTFEREDACFEVIAPFLIEAVM
jgi:pimeloyl-ACP methyl ester carboxylesterase